MRPYGKLDAGESVNQYALISNPVYPQMDLKAFFKKVQVGLIFNKNNPHNWYIGSNVISLAALLFKMYM